MHRESQYTPHLMTPSRGVKDGFGRKGTGMDQHDMVVKLLAFDLFRGRSILMSPSFVR